MDERLKAEERFQWSPPYGAPAILNERDGGSMVYTTWHGDLLFRCKRSEEQEM